MKNQIKGIFILFLSLMILSCNKEEDETSFHNINANLSSLNNVLKKQTVENKLHFKSKNDLNEEEAKEMLKPIIFETISVLINSGITEEEIISEFGSLESPEIAIVGMAMLTENENYNKTYSSKSSPSVLDCAARAFVGMELHEGFWSSFTNRRVLLRMVGKLATRALGFIGAALIVYDFADCMYG